MHTHICDYCTLPYQCYKIESVCEQEKEHCCDRCEFPADWELEGLV